MTQNYDSITARLLELKAYGWEADTIVLGYGDWNDLRRSGVSPEEVPLRIMDVRVLCGDLAQRSEIRAHHIDGDLEFEVFPL